MPYTLVRLASGSYDVDLDGSIVASLVLEPRRGRSPLRWHVELLEATPRAKRPAPFTDQTHTFLSFEEAVSWLGVKEVTLSE
ncbi:hypothetical protein VQ02_03970 [Methylobacterium variabile]|jgi:hypothetical protein|uniref:Uncharacterized protein n=1 Tax=Methylobacterium variabile TaxID=298794 RepID=A0A0J6VSB3_9HYPH|nr:MULTISPECIES: hypothetical protein [Methylobacterium]KMO42116.1 hypothetical protein VQ02_03970 [Methylobacterium variabile]NGM37257.1 hypothetical protein [Methylobacterium sp. DB0501]UHC20386.1 hypothetical protein LRS73_34670 [Methylobacterium currus]